MKILFIGGTGFVGRNVVPILKTKYEVLAPTRKELNLLDTDMVESYIRDNQIDIVIHAAVPNLLPGNDNPDNLFKESLQAFMNLYRLNNLYKKMIYFGSGAEYNKEYEIKYVEETQIGERMPTNDYGLAKFIMNELARKSQNVYNLRIFGCYGPTDADFKLISTAIDACRNGKAIQIRQNALFDFMYVEDIANILEQFINNTPKYHDYNMCTGIRIQNIDVCKTVAELFNMQCDVLVEKDGFGKEYTASNKRLIDEFPSLVFTDLKTGIKKQIDDERNK